MKLGTAFVAMITIVGAGCMAALSTQGAAVRPVTAAQKDRDCQFISVVTASESMGGSPGGDAESAMNEVRNKVAEAGGNAMHVISTDSDRSSTTVVAEALKCTFVGAAPKADSMGADVVILENGR